MCRKQRRVWMYVHGNERIASLVPIRVFFHRFSLNYIFIEITHSARSHTLGVVTFETEREKIKNAQNRERVFITHSTQYPNPKNKLNRFSVPAFAMSN